MHPHSTSFVFHFCSSHPARLSGYTPRTRVSAIPNQLQQLRGTPLLPLCCPSNQPHSNRAASVVYHTVRIPNGLYIACLGDHSSKNGSGSAVSSQEDRELAAVKKMKSHAYFGHWRQLDSEYNLYVQTHGPTERLLTVYIRLQGRAGRISHARNAILSSPSVDNPRARTAFVTAIAHHYPAEKALDELFNTPSSLWSPHVCTAVLHAAGLENRPDLVHVILQEAANRRIETDVTMFDAALRSLGRGGELTEVYQLLNKMLSLGFQPTSTTYEALIYSCAHAQDKHRDALFVQSMGLRACVIYEAAGQKNLLTPPVLSAFASVVLRSRLWNDHRVPSLIQNIRKAIDSNPDSLKRSGVTKDKLQTKLARILYLRAESSEDRT